MLELQVAARARMHRPGRAGRTAQAGALAVNVRGLCAGRWSEFAYTFILLRYCITYEIQEGMRTGILHKRYLFYYIVQYNLQLQILKWR